MYCTNKPPGDVMLQGWGAVTQTPHVGLTRLRASQGYSPRSITFYPPSQTVLTFPPFLSPLLWGLGLHLGSGSTRLIPRGWGMLSSPPEGRCWARVGGVACLCHLIPSGKPTSTHPPQSLLFLRLLSPRGLPSSTSFPIGSCTPEKAGVTAAERTPA